MIDAFGVEQGDISKKGSAATKGIRRTIKALRFDKASRMFGEYETKAGIKKPSAFHQGQKKGWEKGYGPVRSGWEGVSRAITESPGTAGAAAIGGTAVIGGAGYAAGRSRKKDS